jgi:hypothetical protein
MNPGCLINRAVPYLRATVTSPSAHDPTVTSGRGEATHQFDPKTRARVCTACLRPCGLRESDTCLHVLDVRPAEQVDDHAMVQLSSEHRHHLREGGRRFPIHFLLDGLEQRLSYNITTSCP